MSSRSNNNQINTNNLRTHTTTNHRPEGGRQLNTSRTESKVDEDDDLEDLISQAVGITLIDDESSPVATIESVEVHTMPALPSAPTDAPATAPAPRSVSSAAPAPDEPLNVPFNNRHMINPDAQEFLASSEGSQMAAFIHALAQLRQDNVDTDSWDVDEASDSDREHWDGTSYHDRRMARMDAEEAQDLQEAIALAADFARPPSPPTVVPEVPTTVPSPTPSEQEELDEFLNATGLPATGTLEEILEALHGPRDDDNSSNCKDSINDYCDKFFDCIYYDRIPSLDSCNDDDRHLELTWSFIHIVTLCMAFATSILDKSSVCLLALSIIFLNSVLIFGTPLPPRRKSTHRRNYPRRWLILRLYMLLFGSKLMHPDQNVALQLHGSFERAQSLKRRNHETVFHRHEINI